MPRTEALELLARADTLHLASTDEDGLPLLRTLHGVVDEGWLCFHAAPKGEKTEALGKRVVLQVEEVVARIPSTFFDAERACPATTLFRSAQVHGVLEPIDEPVRKARVLQRLMEKLQPQGGYVPIDATHPLYRASVNGLLIAGVRLDEVTGKAKLAQNKNAAQRRMLLEKLWERGDTGDVRTIELIRRANPDTPTPDFLRSPLERTSLHVCFEPHDAERAADLVVDEYWNVGLARETLAAAHRNSTAWVGARDEHGALIATARAISDGSKNGWVYDVGVAKRWRRRGLGKAVVGLLMQHPNLRATKRVWLGTPDAAPLYAQLGFVERSALPPKPYVTTEMARLLR